MRKLEIEESNDLPRFREVQRSRDDIDTVSPIVQLLFILLCAPYPLCVAKDHEQVDTQRSPVSGLMFVRG